MAKADKFSQNAVVDAPSNSLSADALLDMYWAMLLSRQVDERAWVLHRQGRIPFHVSAIGQEACQVAAAFAINGGVDYVAPYYRDLAMMIALGITPLDFLLSLFGKEGEMSSAARQMPSHFSAKDRNILSASAVVSTQVTHAAGLAFAVKYRIEQGLQDRDDDSQPRLALTTIGEGSTSQGDWHEAMNWAGVKQLPYICLVQNNQYAISSPVHIQMAVANVADRAAAYGVEGVIVDGNDIFASYDALHQAVQKAYRGDGPTLIEAKTYRITPHSSDDDDRTYREREEVERWKEKDPIMRFQNTLLERGILTEAVISQKEAQAQLVIDEALQATEDAPYPPAEAALAPIFAEDG